LGGVVHRNEPPGGGLDGRPDGEQSVVLQNDRLLAAERLGKTHAFLLPQHDAGERIEQGMILIECAGILCERIKEPPERSPGLAIGRMGVGRRQNVGPSGMNRGMDDEAGLIDGSIADQNIAVVIDELKIRHFDQTEVLRQRIDPESIRMLGIANGDMAGEPLIETVAGEQPKGRSQTLLSMQPLLLDRGRWLPFDERKFPGCLRGSGHELSYCEDATDARANAREVVSL